MAMLDCIVTMDKTVVSYHTPETKKQSKQWITVKKGHHGTIKARVHASSTKQTLLLFFDNKGQIYTNIMTRGSMVNANYIVKTLGTFMNHLRKKWLEMVSQEWVFHWDNALVHTAAIFQMQMAAYNIQLLQHPPYSSDLAPADFLFRRVKEEVAGI
jgi:hypothetical protein